MSKHSFTPKWYEEEAPAGSYRSIFKWGDLKQFKHPNHHLYDLMKQTFDLTDADFEKTQMMGLEKAVLNQPSRLSAGQLTALEQIVGKENLQIDEFARLKVAYGKTMMDLLRLRLQMVENLPDAVLHPRSTEDIRAIVEYCNRERIPVYIYGGGSSVTRGFEAVCGGIMLDMRTHMKRVIRLNETDQTITVEAGMMGPELEHILNQAPEILGAKRRYTCGHFPQSFEYSAVGGWVVTRGAGQNSTYYGKIEDIVISQEYVTPIGTLKTQDYPRQSTGPDLDQVMMGSEGTFGVLVNATLRVFRWQPESTRRFSYMFKTWEDARAAAREIVQGEFGFPSVFRLSDPEETDVAMRLYGIADTPADTVLKLLGFQPMQKCLLISSADGDGDYTRLVHRKISQICRRYGAFPLGFANVTRRWEKDRFRDPYLREDMQDHGILIDTLECAVTWEQMEEVHRKVREVVKARPQTICMTHLSHAYPQGANLYFIFIAKMNTVEEYLSLQYAIYEAIQKSGAAVSHHHGVGKAAAPWLEGQIGPLSMQVIRTLRDLFDPNHIMNPGGTLGLDLSEEQKNKRWGLH